MPAIMTFARSIRARLIEQGDHPGDILLLSIANRAQHLAIISETVAGVPVAMIHAIAHRPFRVREVPVDDFWRCRIDSIWTWRPAP